MGAAWADCSTNNTIIVPARSQEIAYLALPTQGRDDFRKLHPNQDQCEDRHGFLSPNDKVAISQKRNGMLNLRGETALKFRAIRSPKLTEVAYTLIRISLSFGLGFATSLIFKTSGEPYSVNTIAFIL